VTRLVINADDFGLTTGINRAVAELHAAGVVTSASLMAHAPATEDAIEIAAANPSLGTGCHVVLVDGQPLLSPTHDIPHLADPIDGRFRSSIFSFLVSLSEYSRSWPFRSIEEKEIEAETAAQIALLQSRGLHLTHIDTHKHVHMFPSVLRPVLRAAKAAGICAVRNPFEAAWSVRATPNAPPLRRMEVSLLRRLQQSFLSIVAEEGFTTTNGALGVAATGTLDSATLVSLLRNLPAGTWELVTHPGYHSDDLARVPTRLRASRNIEREALLTLQPPAGTELISFAALTGQ